MYTLGPEEKASVIVVYTQNGLIRGEVVTRENMRLNTWFRTDSAPEYLHLYRLQWIQAVAGVIKPLAYDELLLPLSLVIGFHLAPPSREPLDYDAREDKRVNRPTTIIMGLFVVNGNVRTTAQTDLATSLQISHSPWVSVYDVEISSPHLAQMPPLQTPMMLVRPTHAGFIPHS
jgi:hypothetical protein